MKRINVKLVAILVATTLILGIGSIGLYRFQMRRNTQRFWEQAQSYKAEGDLDNARKSLLRYIQYAPEDKEKVGIFAIWSKEWFDDLIAGKNTTLRSAPAWCLRSRSGGPARRSSTWQLSALHSPARHPSIRHPGEATKRVRWG